MAKVTAPPSTPSKSSSPAKSPPKLAAAAASKSTTAAKSPLKTVATKSPPKATSNVGGAGGRFLVRQVQPEGRPTPPVVGGGGKVAGKRPLRKAGLNFKVLSSSAKQQLTGKSHFFFILKGCKSVKYISRVAFPYFLYFFPGAKQTQRKLSSAGTLTFSDNTNYY